MTLNSTNALKAVCIVAYMYLNDDMLGFKVARLSLSGLIMGCIALKRVHSPTAPSFQGCFVLFSFYNTNLAYSLLHTLTRSRPVDSYTYMYVSVRVDLHDAILSVLSWLDIVVAVVVVNYNGVSGVLSEK